MNSVIESLRALSLRSLRFSWIRERLEQTYLDRNPNDPLPIRHHAYVIKILRHEVAIWQARLEFSRLPVLAEHLGRLEHTRPEERRRPVILFLRQELRAPRTQRAIVAYHQRREACGPKGPRRLRQPGPVIVGDYARRDGAPFRPRVLLSHVTVAIAIAAAAA
jgi:hypothetical protein